jgi:sulfide dehydrogenase [flavocytochrome c] flavoprotein subunit
MNQARVAVRAAALDLSGRNGYAVPRRVGFGCLRPGLIFLVRAESGMKRIRTNRRRFLKSLASAGAAAVVFPSPVIAQRMGPHIVIIGGGFAGATCARSLKKAVPRLGVTLVEPNAVYTALPMSNAVIAGLRDLKQQQFDYAAIQSDGVTLAPSAATAVDPHARSVTLADGTKLAYDRLVVAPGIDFRWEAIRGYSEAASSVIPHAWKGAEQIALLRRQIESMDDGGTIVISAPVNPARCPPAPYERASLIAYYLKSKKPRSKVIVLDSKDSFTMQRLFEGAWKILYPGLIEWVSLSDGGSLTSVDVESRTLVTDFDKYKATVANIIPPQKAGRVAEIASVADRTGWCPVDPVSFASKLQPNIHVIGDAAIAGAMPRSASAANSQAKICAAAIARLTVGELPATSTLTSSCYSLIAPDYAISQRGTYRPVAGQYNEVEGGAIVSPLAASSTLRRAEAEQAGAWYQSITGAVFG